MKKKIIIVDDNSVNRMLLKSVLREEYEVIEAENGKDALELLGSIDCESISAILLDLVMPIMGGFEMMSIMQDDVEMSKIPVIVATGSTDETSEAKALMLGASDFVMKPYNPTLIKHSLRNTINQNEMSLTLNSIQRDKLTGLYNREAFFGKVENMVKEKEPGYYIMSCFDIDKFKLINDQYGAAVGDKVLKQIGKIMGEEFPAVGGIAGHISADNFASLYPVQAENNDVAERMRKTIEFPDNSSDNISYSVGRYVVSDISLLPSAMYDRAYIAKQSVKGRYDIHIAYFDEAMRDKLLREKEIISEMADALKKEQFEVWFQPQFNHSTGACVGAEALVRWRHPKRGLVPPGEFIPIFEKNGFVYELDKFVWERSCKYLRKWIDEGRNPLPVSVNISRYDIFRSDLVDVIVGLIKKYDIPIDLLRLEVTESAFAESQDQIIAVVSKLADCGFLVEIDDFGSGYSSLNTLKDVPAHVLKLDMRFLEDTNNSQRGGNILESIVRMAKWINMSVIAEGVEELEQADYLKSIGCNYIQGYLYAKPMPAIEYEVLAKTKSKEERLLTMETVENLDNNAFWDPKSLDTLIFNSYIGGACVMEYHKNKIELLRANDKYLETLGNSGIDIEQALRLNWVEHMSAPDFERLMDDLRQSVENVEEVTDEFVFFNIPGAEGDIYLRSNLRVIATAGDRHLIYCTNENITAQREAEREIRETDEQLRFLNDAAHDMLTQADSDGAINTVLEKLQKFFDGNRAYIFEFDYENGVCCNTYETCKEGIEAQKHTLQNLPLEVVDFWLHAFDDEKIINIEDVDKLDDARAEKGELQRQGIKSLVAVPLIDGKKLIGFIGIDDPKSQQGRTGHITAIGDYITVMLSRRDAARRAKKEEATQQQMIGEALGAVMKASQDISFVKDREGRYICCSRPFAESVGLEDAKDVIGKTDYELTDKKLADKYHQTDMRILNTGDAMLNFVEIQPSKDGSSFYCSVSKYPLVDSEGNIIGIYGVGHDITPYHTTFDELRIREEQFRIAASLGDRTVARYDIKTGTYYNDSELLYKQGFGDVIENVPQAFIDAKLIDDTCVDDYLEVYEKLREGARSATATIALRMPDGAFRCFKLDATSLYDEEAKPSEAILVFFDVTEEREKEAVYKKWQMSLEERSLESFTLFRSNLNKNSSFDSVEGDLLQIQFGEATATFNMRTAEYAEKFVYPDDRPEYIATLDSDSLLANYYRGIRTYTLEYREMVSTDKIRWLKLSVELVEYPNSTDVEAYLMYENIDERKQAELETRELAEIDPLTKILNRNAFVNQLNRMIKNRESGTVHVLMMFDIDGFKLVNDSFGHAAGDNVLIDIAKSLKLILRQGDLIGRLGGDEFLVCLKNVSNKAVIGKKARQICNLVRKSFSIDVHMSASLGIAMCPNDGEDFETLYRKADIALYNVKATGKDGYIFYNEGMSTNNLNTQESRAEISDESDSSRELRRSMLIVEDNRVNRDVLANIFKAEFNIETAENGNDALIKLRRYGSSISIVLLDLVMPGMDGFAVLEKMQSSAEMKEIPVIVVSGTDEQETGLKSIKYGASDFVTKPVNPDLIKMRVNSAISRVENNRLRVQNSYLELQSNEVEMYKVVIENEGIVIVEYDCVNDIFAYDKKISDYMAGDYDNRTLWEIFSSDQVTDWDETTRLKNLIRDLRDNKSLESDTIIMNLKTPGGARHYFNVRVVKCFENDSRGDKYILAFTDVERKEKN